MKITIMSEGLAGHRKAWLESLVEASKIINLEIVLIVVSNSLDREIVELMDEFPDVEMIFLGSKREAIRYVSLNATDSYFIFWDADNWLWQLLRFRYPCRALFLRYALNKKSLWSLLKSLAKLNLIWLIDALRRNVQVGVLISPFLPKTNGRLLEVSDDLIVELLRRNAPKSRSSKDKSPDIQFLIPGFITWRKRPDLIVNYLENFGSSVAGYSCKFIFCGSIDVEVGVYLSKYAKHKFEIIDEYLEYSKYLEVLSNATAILLPYDDLGSSNILTEAIYLGIPVVIKGNSYWGRMKSAFLPYLYISNYAPRELQGILSTIVANRNTCSRLSPAHFEELFLQNEVLKFFLDE